MPGDTLPVGPCSRQQGWWHKGLWEILEESLGRKFW